MSMSDYSSYQLVGSSWWAPPSAPVPLQRPAIGSPAIGSPAIGSSDVGFQASASGYPRKVEELHNSVKTIGVFFDGIQYQMLSPCRLRSSEEVQRCIRKEYEYDPNYPSIKMHSMHVRALCFEFMNRHLKKKLSKFSERKQELEGRISSTSKHLRNDHFACRFCNQMDHSSDDCPVKVTRKVMRPGYRCHNCNEYMSHLREDCPYSRQRFRK